MKNSVEDGCSVGDLLYAHPNRSTSGEVGIDLHFNQLEILPLISYV